MRTLTSNTNLPFEATDEIVDSFANKVRSVAMTGTSHGKKEDGFVSFTSPTDNSVTTDMVIRHGVTTNRQIFDTAARCIAETSHGHYALANNKPTIVAPHSEF